MGALSSSLYPRGIELVGGVVVENESGEVLLVQSPKWGSKWVLPGGHVEPGETVLAAQVREAEEETGLELKPVAVFAWGELIGSKDFHRPAHFIYFDVHAYVVGGTIRLDGSELVAHRWVAPAEALRFDLGETYDKTIRDFIAYRTNS